MKISLVVVVDEADGIGFRNQLLCHLPADLKHFKHMTTGKPILMGRQTFGSIGRPLPQRRNIVLTHQNLGIDGVECVSSLDTAWDLLQHEQEVMVIGGMRVYEQTLPLAASLYLTRIHHCFEQVDVYFPALEAKAWQVEILGGAEADEKNPYAMTFYCYNRL
ncbi:MAG: dihydrofolate reductase [Gammaproteobacteria bacterium]|nr:dihydrofolate reductase [Gammaproteobacteria bacterium]